MLKIIHKNKEYTSYEFAEKLGVNYGTLRQFIKRNRNYEKLNYLGKEFSISYQLSVRTIINKQWKDKNNLFTNNLINLPLILKQWRALLKKYPSNTDYQDFFNLLTTKNKEQGDAFNYYRFCREYLSEKELWMCDTETTFTALVPNKYLFKDEKKAYGADAKETLMNLHLKRVSEKKELEKLSPKQRKQVNKDGIRDFFDKNADIKPYMWAWIGLNFKTGERILLNYNDAVTHLDTIEKNVKQYYHNLSYDALYVASSLIEEKGYQFYYVDPKFREEYRQKKKKQPKKTIYIFAKDNKIFAMDIVNSLGRKISAECTYLKTMASVNRLGEILKMPKKELNYLTPREKNHVFTEEEKDYIITDVEIVVKFLTLIQNSYKQRFKKELKWGITLGMTSMTLLKEHVGKEAWNAMFVGEKDKKGKLIPIISADESKYLREFYNGGYTNYNIKYIGQVHNWISSLDIKSSYPDKWQHYNIPNGRAIYNCLCDDNDLKNQSLHFKVYELKILKNIKIIEGKENMIPTKLSAINDDGKMVSCTEYYPFMTKGTYYVSQYMLQIFKILFQPQNDEYQAIKTTCFKHNLIEGFVDYVNLWKEEKEQPNLKSLNPVYYEFCKYMLNGPTGKFGQQEIEDETVFVMDERNCIKKDVIPKVHIFDEIGKYHYLPVIIATTDMGRLHLLSLIEEVGWDVWHNSDTDSAKFWLPKKYQPKNKPTYFNYLTEKTETIYNEDGKNEFGKFSFEWCHEKFKCSGKKKYIHGDDNNYDVVCAGATETIRKTMNFDNFFCGYHSQPNEKNMVAKLNGLPVILPTTFQIKNVFLNKHTAMMGFKHLLHDYYIDNIERINEEVKKNKEQIGKEFVDYTYSNQDELDLSEGVFS